MRYFGWLIAGFVCYRLSRALEAMGDAAPYAAEGTVATERLQYHGSALVVLLAGGACFVRAGILIWRAIKKPPLRKQPEAPAEPEFDPDAALAHYLETRGDRPPSTPRPGGFGRKGT